MNAASTGVGSGRIQFFLRKKRVWMNVVWILCRLAENSWEGRSAVLWANFWPQGRVRSLWAIPWDLQQWGHELYIWAINDFSPVVIKYRNLAKLLKYLRWEPEVIIIWILWSVNLQHFWHLFHLVVAWCKDFKMNEVCPTFGAALDEAGSQAFPFAESRSVNFVANAKVP